MGFNSRHDDLNTLLEPASIAIVGASDNPDKIGGRPIFYMRRHGYAGTIYPINPQRVCYELSPLLARDARSGHRGSRR